jgi:hypothetical protein
MADTLTRRDVAHLAREFGQATGLDGFGTRGRVSENLVFQYLSAQAPKDVRTIAAALGVEVKAKGHLSDADLIAVAATVARNAPKAEAGE